MDISKFETSLYNTLDNSLFDFGFYHPYVVDFAVTLPVLALFLHFVSILTQADESSSKVYYKVSNMLFFIGVFFMVFAYITGLAEGNDIREALSVEGRGVYDAHKTLGSYLVIAFIFLCILKIISLLVKKDPIRYIFGTLITITLLILIYSYALGISLVFDYGAGVACSR